MASLFCGLNLSSNNIQQEPTMATTAFMTTYKPEFIAVFERTQSLLRATTTTEASVRGTSAVFLNAGSGGAAATTRGVNGLIAARNNSLTQNTVTLTEWHDLVEATRFTTDMSQGDIRKIMQQNSVQVLNRKIDDQIIAELDTATNDTGTSATASLDMVAKSLTILGNNDVDTGDVENLFGLITPAFMGYLMQTKEFGSADYVESKPLVGPAKKMLRWYGVNWIVHSGLTGLAGATEKCYLYHKNAIGHAANTAELNAAAGYDERQDFYYARASMFMGAKLLQNAGVVQMKHDGSAYSAA
jgi:hypothetical protein